MKRLLVQTVVASLAGHVLSLLLLLLLTAVALGFADPSGAVMPLALIAMGIGAGATGLFSRKTGTGLFGGLLAGFFFALIPLLGSLFFAQGGAFGVGGAFLVALGSWALSVLFSFIGAKKRKKRAASLSSRKKRMTRRI